MKWLLTGDAARVLGVSPDLVRRLERKGELVALRTSRGTRLFRLEDVVRVRDARATRARKARAPASPEVAGTPDAA
jgi:excisionase family DNA binding protein